MRRPIPRDVRHRPSGRRARPSNEQAQALRRQLSVHCDVVDGVRHPRRRRRAVEPGVSHHERADGAGVQPRLLGVHDRHFHQRQPRGHRRHAAASHSVGGRIHRRCGAGRPRATSHRTCRLSLRSHGHHAALRRLFHVGSLSQSRRGGHQPAHGVALSR